MSYTPSVTEYKPKLVTKVDVCGSIFEPDT